MWVDIFVVVFVIVNIIGKFVNGIVDDLFFIIFLVFDKFVLIVFVMNFNMFENVIVK